MEVIGEQVARKEVAAWLDFQGTTEAQRAAFAPSVDKIIDGVMNGLIIIDPDTFQVTQKLKFPFGLETKISEFKIKPHLKVSEVNEMKNKLDMFDHNANVFAHFCAATGELPSVIFEMNNKDFAYSNAITFFLIV